MFAIYKRELRSYFVSPIGYIFVAIFLLASSLLFSYCTLQAGANSSTAAYFSTLMYVFIVVLPLLTMKLFADEKKMRTEQLLLTSPVSLMGMVMAKFLAAYTVFAGTYLISCMDFIVLYQFGTPNTAILIGSSLAILLAGAACIAVGVFISSLTESQVIAAVVSLAVMVFINLMSGLANLIPATSGASLAGFIAIAVIIGMIVQVMIKSTVISVSVSVVLTAGCVLVYLGNPAIFEGAIPSLLSSMALFDRMGSFQNGMFDMTAIIFYLSVIALFVYLTVQSMEKKRWN